MVKHNKTIRRQIAEELFMLVWPKKQMLSGTRLIVLKD